MDTSNSSAPARPPTEIEEQAHARLLDAAREALAWFDRHDMHAPEEARFGGEGRVRRLLRDAVRRCSFETRPCPDCDGGFALAPAMHPTDRPKRIPCPQCGGSGKVRVFAYGPPKARRSR